MWDLPFVWRLVILVAFLSLVSALELLIRGRRATRWRAAVLILISAVAGAAFGVAVDLITSSISPAYFSIGKGLGNGPGLDARIRELGLQAGCSAGTILGAVVAWFGYGRRDSEDLPLGRALLWMRVPLLWALSFALALALLIGSWLPPDALGGIGVPLPMQGRRAFTVVWCAHSGLYMGALFGLLRVRWQLRSSRSSRSVA